MEITNDLIQKFFENKCDPEEFEAVTHYLELHPEEKAYRMGWEAWDAIGVAHALSNDNDDQAAALQQLKERLFRKSLIRRLTIPAVAASLLLATGGIWMVARRANDKDMTGRTAGRQSAPARTAWDERTNSTGKPKIITMPDGSEIKLFAHSSLRYSDSFGISRRDVWLDGAADFSVKKDKNHPFTVISGSLATTVLGTSFGIKAPAADGMFTLRLFTGRVVVRPVKTLPGWNKDIYLFPGQQLLYNDRLMLANVNRFRKESPVLPGPSGREPAGDDRKDLVFNNTSLKEVFDQLSIQYHRKINYAASDLTGMNFTGTVPRSDSLVVFLKLLATMNNLEVQEKEPVLVIARHSDH